MADIEDRIRDRVEQFAEELMTLIRQAALETLTQAVGGGSSSGRGRGGRKAAGRGAARASTPPRSAAPARRAKGAKRPAEELEQLTSSLATYVKKNPGQRVEQIAKGMEVTTKDLRLPVVKLIEAGSLKTKGQKRATQYFPK